MEFDVVVSGAGPAGSKTAVELARLGARVLLLEEHAQVGTPNHCSGLVTPRTLTEAGIGPWVVQNRISGAVVYSTGGSRVRLGGGKIRALTINREALDVWLAQEAASAGAELALG